MCRRAARVNHPPPPWHLRGRMYLSVWLARPRAVPGRPPAGVRPVPVLGRRAVICAWVVYEPDGTLAYNELLTAVPVRARGRFMASVTRVWVDSAASRDGGRELWGIPKEPATFTTDQDGRTFRAHAHDDNGPIAAAMFRPYARLPGRWARGGRVAQTLAGRLTTTPVRAGARVTLARARWDFPPHGPLSGLRGCRPVLTLILEDLRLRFGTAPPDGTAGPAPGRPGPRP
jgi:hypothetical protein